MTPEAGCGGGRQHAVYDEAYASNVLFWDSLDWLLRKLFGEQRGENLRGAIGVLFGVFGLVFSVVSRSWWLAVLSVLIVAFSGASLLRGWRLRPDPSEDPGLLSEVRSNPSRLNPLHHEPLPPFPGTPDDEPK